MKVGSAVLEETQGRCGQHGTFLASTVDCDLMVAVKFSVVSDILQLVQTRGQHGTPVAGSLQYRSIQSLAPTSRTISKVIESVISGKQAMCICRGAIRFS